MGNLTEAKPLWAETSGVHMEPENIGQTEAARIQAIRGRSLTLHPEGRWTNVIRFTVFRRYPRGSSGQR